MARPLTFIAALALSLTAAGCSTRETPRNGPAPAPAAPVTVRVTNHNWADMVVYAHSGGLTRRLGSVTSMTTQTFRLPRSLAIGGSRLNLIADPIGGVDRFVASPVSIWPGQVLEFAIHNQIAVSSVTSWRQE